jgi:hypothetical protein
MFDAIQLMWYRKCGKNYFELSAAQVGLYQQVSALIGKGNAPQLDL